MTAFDRDFTMTIGGQSVTGTATIPVLNPATEEAVAEAPDCSMAELDAAVAAARAAFAGWRATPIDQRRVAVAKIAEVISTNLDQFARLFTQEQGRPVAKATEELMGAAFWAASVAKQEIPVL